MIEHPDIHPPTEVALAADCSGDTFEVVGVVQLSTGETLWALAWSYDDVIYVDPADLLVPETPDHRPVQGCDDTTSVWYKLNRTMDLLAEQAKADLIKQLEQSDRVLKWMSEGKAQPHFNVIKR